jgi:sortase A
VRIARYAGLVLTIGGLLLIGYALYEGFSGTIYQAWQGRKLDRELDTTVPPAPAAPHRPSMRYEKGSAIGRLEIPRLGLSVVVLEGSDHAALRLGVGRVPDSSLPDEPGNVVLAGHRDTFFRSLREIRPGDQISLRTTAGTFAYTVNWTRVVKPTDTSVIMPTPSQALTLVTCYPFYYVGPAPERFIVRALPPSTVSTAEPAPYSGKPSPFAPLHRPVAQPAVAPIASPAAGPVAVPPLSAAVETATPATPKPSALKRALHGIAGVFSPHRDTLQ